MPVDSMQTMTISPVSRPAQMRNQMTWMNARQNQDELLETRDECSSVFTARLDVCVRLSDAPHDPDFGEDFADGFVDPLEIGSSIDPNPWFPLIQGYQWTYEATFEEDGEEITETIIVSVTDKVKMIEGVACLVVNDIVVVDDQVIEDTDDWIAQDVDGNLYYCGEVSRNYEAFDGDDPEDAELVDLEGSWKSGRDDAKAGLLMPNSPQVGDVLRQEIAWADAEDVIEILSLTGDETTSVASCDGQCLVTLDFSPLDPGAIEHKYYASGIGMIVEVKPDDDERLELIDFSM